MKNQYLLLACLLLAGCQWNLEKNVFDKPCVKPSASISAPTGTLLTSAALPFALTGKAGDIETVTWDFGDGSAPKTGESVSYMYTKTGPFTVKATLTNRCNQSTVVTQAITVDSKDVPAFTIATSNIRADSARVTLTFSSTGKNTPINEFGVTYSSTNMLPTIAADKVIKYKDTPGATVGMAYGNVLPGLTAGAVYYVRGYCKTDAPDPIYSAVVSFTTGINQPTINTLPISEIEVDRAKISVQFTSRGSTGVTVTEYGFCYSDTQNPPTIADNPTKLTGAADPAMIYSTVQGGLTGGKTYYVRAYAKTDRSPDPIYGPVQSFKTQPEPDIATLDATGLASKTAVLGARVTNIAQFTAKEVGVCYSHDNNPPTIADLTVRISSNFQTDNFYNVSNLTAGFVYYYRAFVILPSGGFRYGPPVKQLTTPSPPAVAPTVVTVDAVDIKATKANLVMSVSAAPTALAAYGIVFSKTNAVPSLTNGSTVMANKSPASALSVSTLYAFITDTDYMLTLEPNTLYYYRGYATTIAVNGKAETGYGDPVKTFKTLAAAAFVEPTVVAVTGGTFTMGTDSKDATIPLGQHDGDEGPAHKVTLSSFSMGKYEISVSQYRDYITATGGTMPTTGFTLQDNFPISNISYDEAVAYCAWLSTKTGKKYRLPTEAEWEYAARGGLQFKGTGYAGSNVANDVGWNNTNGANTPHPVGQKLPNELGLFDMSGNVWEIVSDLYSYTYYASSANSTNPTGATAAQQATTQNTGVRTKRGGSFALAPLTSSVIDRGQITTDKIRSGDVGFRIVLQP